MQNRSGILFVLNSLVFGGAEKHVVTLLNALSTTTFRLSLACIKTKSGLADQLDTSRLQATHSLNVESGFSWRAVRELAKFIDALDVDVVVCTNPYAVFYGFFAARLAARPVKLVEVFHTTKVGTTKEAFQMFFYQFLFRQCDLLVYVSELQRSFWRAQGMRARNDIVIHNGIDTDYFIDRYSAAEKQQTRATLGFSAGDYVIGICAALRPEKAHGDLLQALWKIRDGGITSAKVMIIGDGPQRRAIEESVRSLGLQSATAITGFQSDVRPYIAACDVMTLTSHAVETFSIAALESMALGKPMLLSRIGGAAEQVTHGYNGFLFEPGDILALSECLTVCADSARRAQMGLEAARSVRTHFRIDQMISAFNSELLSVVLRT